MYVDRELIDAAEQALRAGFPCSGGSACATYSSGGRLLTASHESSADLEAISVCRTRGELITAMITLAWDGAGSTASVRPPAAAALAGLESQARRHAQIAVGGTPSSVVVRPLWELVLERGTDPWSNPARTEGRFGGGMKSIAAELFELAKIRGVARVRDDFSRLLLAALQHERIRANAAAPAPRGSQFVAPTQLDSVALRHLWLAFETAAESLVYGLVDVLRPELSAAGCNEADVVHIKQGFEALRNTFSALFVFVGTRQPVLNECPFYPYDSFRLREGVPLHAYLRLSAPGDPALSAGVAECNERLVQQLISVLASREEGGFARYLRQRNLFSVDLFDGGGPGHCPFAVMSIEIVHASAMAFTDALARRLLILAPDRPVS